MMNPAIPNVTACTFNINPLAFAVSSILTLGVHNLHAATINVTANAVDTTVNANCSLIEAIQAANGDTAVDNCIAGSGNDTLVLPASSTFTFTTGGYTADGNNALPDITTNITIQGNTSIIERDTGTAANFRLFHISAAGDLTLDDITLRNGLVTGDGGAIFSRGSLTISDSIVSGNEASDSAGGIYTYTGSITTINTSTISDNRADGNHGGGIFNRGTVSLVESTVSNNYAETHGGGIYNSNNDVITLTNSTVSGNHADNNGGGFFNRGSVTLNSSTIADNYARTAGGGIDNVSGRTVTLNQSIIADSTGDVDCDNDGTVNDNDSLIEDNSCGDGVLIGDPLLDVLTNNGGSTETHALMAASTAINAGGACGLGTDQRGVTRDANCDLGAYEFSSGPEIEVDIAGSTLADGDVTEPVAFGSPPQGSTQTRTVTLTNNGTSDLTLSTPMITGDTEFSLNTTGFTTTVTASNSTSFDIELDTTNIGGPFSGTVTFTSDDADEASYTLNLSGSVSIVTAPEIEVDIAGSTLTDGDVTEPVAFGTVTQSSTQTRTVTITNNGNADLTLGTPMAAGDAEFTLNTVGFTTTVTAGNSTSFDIELDTTNIGGPFNGTVTFTSDDADEASYTLTLSGTVAAATPEIEVDIAGSTLADGDVAEPVAFGTVTQGSTQTRTVTITNNGSANLTLGTPMVAGDAEFTLDTVGFTTTVAVGNSTSFNIELDTANIGGPFNSTATFTSNDGDEASYTLTLSGTVDAVPTSSSRTLIVEVNGMGTLTSTPAGIDCPADCQNSYTHRSLVSLFATPDDGWQFESWGGDCTDSPSMISADVVMSTNRQCTINFTEIPVTSEDPDKPSGSEDPEDNADPGIISFTQGNYIVNENDGVITINVSRTGQAEGAVSIDYALTPDTETVSDKYTDTSGTLFWDDGETGNQNFTIVILDNDNIDGNDSLTISLGNATPSGLDIAIDTATLTIVDDDMAPELQPGQTQFLEVTGQILSVNIVDDTMLVTVPEAAGELIINVDRRHGIGGDVSIDFDVIPAMSHMATFPDDFLLAPGTLNWSDQNNDVQSFSLRIVDDFAEENTSETFFIELHNPTGNLLLGSPSLLGFTIIDNDGCIDGERGITVDSNNAIQASRSCFVNYLDGAETPMPLDLNVNDTHATAIRIKVEEADLGQPADLLLLGGYRAPGSNDFEFFEKRAEAGWVMHENGVATLPEPLDSFQSLPGQIDVVLHYGNLRGFPGDFVFYVGYLLPDGKLVFNGNSLHIWHVE